ncbi:putative VWFC domain-containing protein [Seiridium cardinale]|uniref:VWFC domain-containing protein n=1 Tax=Seiridium cardinale TaxID=138064 RepID=A0ABR2XBR4_9PEZI
MIKLLVIVSVFAGLVIALTGETEVAARAAQVTPYGGGGYGQTPTPTLPGSCFTTWDDFEHTTGGVKGPDCFTYTSTTTPASCPSCAADSTLVCPLFIRVTTTSVPCSTDCCPTTPTAYVDGPCPTCGQCNIPTETTVQTTGCSTDPDSTRCWLPEGCSTSTTSYRTAAFAVAALSTPTQDVTKCWLPEGCSTSTSTTFSTSVVPPSPTDVTMCWLPEGCPSKTTAK